MNASASAAQSPDAGGQGPTLGLDQQGRLVLTFGLFNEGFKEPICCKCGERIRWCLDMFSFTHNDRGGYDLGHAYCLWTPEAFTDVRKLAVKAQQQPAASGEGGSR